MDQNPYEPPQQESVVRRPPRPLLQRIGIAAFVAGGLGGFLLLVASVLAILLDRDRVILTVPVEFIMNACLILIAVGSVCMVLSNVKQRLQGTPLAEQAYETEPPRWAWLSNLSRRKFWMIAIVFLAVLWLAVFVGRLMTDGG